MTVESLESITEKNTTIKNLILRGSIMERLTRLCKNTENGKYISHVIDDYTGIYPNCALGHAVEQGKLIILVGENENGLEYIS